MTADRRTIRGVARRISDLIVKGNRASYELGREIGRVYEEDLWPSWEDGSEYATFNDWCWEVLGFKERKARYLRTNYASLDCMNVGEVTLSRALRLGWTKLAHVLRVAKNEMDLIRWIDRVEEEKLSEEDLRAEVALVLAPANEDPDDEPTDTDEPTTTTTKRLIKYPLTFTVEEDLRIFVKSLKLIRRRVNPEMSFGEAAALMATSYLGTAARDDEGGLAVELETILQAVERTYNCKLVLADEQPRARRVVTDEPTVHAGAVAAEVPAAAASDESEFDF